MAAPLNGHKTLDCVPVNSLFYRHVFYFSALKDSYRNSPLTVDHLDRCY